MPPKDRNDREEGVGVLGIVAWIGLFGLTAWAVNEALSFFPEGWRWTNLGERGRPTTMSLRQTLALIVALPISAYTVALLGELGRRLRGEPSPCEEDGGESAPRPGIASHLGRLRGRHRGVGCGAIVLVLAGATALLRPAALFLFPLAGLDPDDGGILPFALWMALASAGFSAVQIAARIGSGSHRASARTPAR